jgi:hypothetical protein
MTIVAVVGLGYVGLPLAVEFGKKGRTIGFDLSASKVAHYRQHVDPDRRGEQRRSQGGDSSGSRHRCGCPGERRISSSSPCRRRSTRRISRISDR